MPAFGPVTDSKERVANDMDTVVACFGILFLPAARPLHTECRDTFLLMFSHPPFPFSQAQDLEACSSSSLLQPDAGNPLSASQVVVIHSLDAVVKAFVAGIEMENLMS